MDTASRRVRGENELWAAGAPVPDAEELIRRYCGLPDTQGDRETWAYAYYDARPSSSLVEVELEDVLATAAFGTKLTQRCLDGWIAARPAIRDVLEKLPEDLVLEEASEGDLGFIEDLVRGLTDGESLAVPQVPDADRPMVTEVLHRKRPRLIPLYDRGVADRYVRGLGDKRYRRGVDLVRAVRDDLRDERNAKVLREIQGRLAVALDGGPVPSRLRLFDIALWMDNRLGG